MEISFGAIYRDSATVRKVSDGKTSNNVNAAVVELDLHNLNDGIVMEEVANEFSKNNKKGNYAKNISDSFYKTIDKGVCPPTLHHYLLTTQESDFASLETDKVIGAFMIQDKLEESTVRVKKNNIKTKYVTKLKFLQGSPKNYFGNPEREYSGCGEAMSNFVKKNYTKYDIIVNAAEDAMPFYESQGYKKCNEDTSSTMMIYYAPNLLDNIKRRFRK